MVGNRIKQLREENAISQTELASKIGVSKQTLYKYENNIITNIPSDKIELMAHFLNTSPSYIMGWKEIPITFKGVASFGGSARVIDGNANIPANLTPIEPMERIPLLGTIACGDPILAQENIEDYIDLPRTIKADFALTCEGDSMIDAGIKDGDVVYIRSQPEVQNGQIAAVLVDGESAMLKRFFFSDGVVTLMAANQSYPPIVKAGTDVEQVKVLGLAVGLSRSFFK